MTTLTIRRAAVLFAVLPACARGQPPAPQKWADTVRAEIEAAQLASDLPRLQAARAITERVLTAYPGDALMLHYQGYALFREAALVAAQGGDATPLFVRARAVLEAPQVKRPEALALLAAIYGRLIGADPSQAMPLGMAIQRTDGEAMMAGPANPRVWLVKGMNAIYTPPEYGGGVDVAKKQLTRAIELFAKDSPKPGEPNWGLPEAHAWLGQVHERSGDKAAAMESYTKALEVAPDYRWVRHVLIPGLNKPAAKP